MRVLLFLLASLGPLACPTALLGSHLSSPSLPLETLVPIGPHKPMMKTTWLHHKWWHGLQQIIRDNLPENYEDTRKWDLQKEVWDGVDVSHDGLKIRQNASTS